MNHLLTIEEKDVSPNSPVVNTAGFQKREAARVVVIDSSGKVAMLHVGLYGYHKLPGGGIDGGEDIATALT